MADTEQRILVGYNLYFTSDEVTKVAIKHAKAFAAKLYVVSSIVGHSLDKNGIIANPEARARLDRLEALLKKENIPHEIHLIVRKSDPGDDLVRFAIDHDIDEMVIGFKVRSPLGEIIFGSNYRTMIAEAPCPVVTVHVPGEPVKE
ncbi:MAG: universal stress protein [Desulfocapsaceae bacterium]|jgi:nucleotide-binding universal stress UspA family protein|nr:universal stress protein [Desulfocapsaceae bacterium]